MCPGPGRRLTRPGRAAGWLLALALGWAVASGAPAGKEPPAEYQLKAVFLFNFAQFVEWPEAAFSAPEAALVIGVLGENPFGNYLDELVHGETIGARPLLVRRARRVEELDGCHIVFICRSETREMERIINRLRARPLLSVSDADSFTRHGGMVRFALENGKIRLRINVEAAKASHLTISSKVLRPDTVVNPGETGP